MMTTEKPHIKTSVYKTALECEESIEYQTREHCE
jgi:hypothetical protein